MSGGIVVFAGPTISRGEIYELCPEAVVLGPAEQGEVLTVARALRPRAIGIIDGVWQNCPSIWHKEILNALELGVAIAGSSSMGALRAVECEPWGAVPVGKVAEWIKEGLISDEDVVLSHGEGPDYRGLSIPTVNLRVTLDRMAQAWLLEREDADAILADVAKIFYAERTWRTIADAVGEDTARGLQDNYFDQKAEDARELLRILPGLTVPEFRRPAENARRSYGVVVETNDLLVPDGSGGMLRLFEVADAHQHIEADAINRALALEYALRMGLDAEPGELPDESLARSMDLLPDEVREIRRQEVILARARRWMNASESGFGRAACINNYLRSRGLWTEAKQQSLIKT